MSGRMESRRSTPPRRGRWLPSAGCRREDVAKLQAALQELSECRRLLDAALAEKV